MIEMRKIIISLDVGGTEIKAAPVSGDGELLMELRHFPAQSDRSAEEILGNMTRIINVMRSEGDVIEKICFAFPGPFDYQNGVSLIRGLDKYDSLYGVNLREYFAGKFGIPAENVRFCNDVAGFALGEMYFGKAGVSGKAMFVCIGTGCGSAFSIGGQLCGGGEDNVPTDGYIYNHPFMDGCVDDYISKRGIAAITESVLGTPLNGKELEDLTRGGNSGAVRCYGIFGGRLKDALSPFLDSFKPDVLCVGGQITKNGERFLSPLAEKCGEIGCRLYTSDDTSKSAVLGASLL